ncbi:capsule assembly Wzi family protein [Colwellia sp. Arc7-D]|uniref:capsule assembly Wzi family protein n=1 Tax=Colwellia sp. Arc7-D TaxID=2161872 RepID=UPI0013A53F54|nr:capsule assembly Wzi family protein [Colwellia sp. Arc7-D]
MKLHKLSYTLFLFCFFTSAEPWIDTSNIYLRSSIQQLADAGHIKTPVTTFPLMWLDIGRDLKHVDYSSLNSAEKQAFDYVNHQFRMAKNNSKKLELNIANKDKRFTSFGEDFRDKNNIKIQTSHMTESFAFGLSTSYTFSPEDNDNTRFDGSYVAGFIGNWVVSLGKQDRWWGPGWDSNLSLTNNARPIPALSISRRSAIPLEIPFTEIEIPWTVTSFMGVMDDKRVIDDTLLWGFRLNFQPFDGLEVGLTRLAQFGGKDRSQSLSTFFNVLVGKDNCGASGLDCGVNKENEPGNQQAGYDLRYSFNVLNTPIGLYGQYFAEDGDNSGSSLSFLTEPKVQVGIDTNLKIFSAHTKVYLEYTDTYADCADIDNRNIGNCYYEHHIYQTGMRYQQRTLGNLYDNDATSVVLGFISTIDQNTNVTSKIRHLQLNTDNNDKAPGNNIIGNPLTEVAEDLIMVSTKVQHSYKNWRYTLGLDLSRSTFENDIKDKKQANLFLKVEYNL